jgi:hypothetical protein
VSFPHVRAFRSIDGWGFHFLASMEPIPSRDAAALASRLPPDAAPISSSGSRSAAGRLFERMLATSSTLRAGRSRPRHARAHGRSPVNEYFFLRWWSGARTLGAARLGR